MTLQEFLVLDLPAILTAMLACVACSLVGSFLVLRRQALLADAVSHVVLPGIVGAVLVTGALTGIVIMAGALVAALVAVAAIELLRACGRLEAGAAMGTVFTTMFAVGVAMLEWSDVADGYIDARHVVFGSLETVLWMSPGDLTTVPRQIVTLAVVLAVLCGLYACFHKELAVSTFDPALAALLGFRPRLVAMALVTATGAAAVAAFEAVGSILVIAMFVGPPCVARMLTDRLSLQIRVSVLVAAVAAVVGYVLAAFGPGLYGSANSLNAAGTIAVTVGILQVLTMLFAPRYGALSATRRRQSSQSATR